MAKHPIYCDQSRNYSFGSADPEGIDIDISGHEIEGNLYFWGILRHVRMKVVTVGGDFDASDVTYTGDVFQSFSTFKGPVYQSHSTFESPVDQSNSTFGDFLDQSHSTFEGDVDQSNSTFGDFLDQSHSTFKGGLDQAGSRIKELSLTDGDMLVNRYDIRGTVIKEIDGDGRIIVADLLSDKKTYVPTDKITVDRKLYQKRLAGRKVA
jgi:hypothetical protein